MSFYILGVQLEGMRAIQGRLAVVFYLGSDLCGFNHYVTPFLRLADQTWITPGKDLLSSRLHSARLM